MGSHGSRAIISQAHCLAGLAPIATTGGLAPNVLQPETGRKPGFPRAHRRGRWCHPCPPPAVMVRKGNRTGGSLILHFHSLASLLQQRAGERNGGEKVGLPTQSNSRGVTKGGGHFRCWKARKEESAGGGGWKRIDRAEEQKQNDEAEGEKAEVRGRRGERLG